MMKLLAPSTDNYCVQKIIIAAAYANIPLQVNVTPSSSIITLITKEGELT
jgi:hypothetical protein